MRPSYLYIENSYTGTMASLYWNIPLFQMDVVGMPPKIITIGLVLITAWHHLGTPMSFTPTCKHHIRVNMSQRTKLCRNLTAASGSEPMFWSVLAYNFKENTQSNERLSGSHMVVVRGLDNTIQHSMTNENDSIGSSLINVSLKM